MREINPLHLPDANGSMGSNIYNWRVDSAEKNLAGIDGSWLKFSFSQSEVSSGAAHAVAAQLGESFQRAPDDTTLIYDISDLSIYNSIQKKKLPKVRERLRELNLTEEE